MISLQDAKMMVENTANLNGIDITLILLSLHVFVPLKHLFTFDIYNKDTVNSLISKIIEVPLKLWSEQPDHCYVSKFFNS